MKQQKSNLARAYLEHCGALEGADIMIEVLDKMIDARTELLRRALPMLSGAGAGVLAAEICVCIGMRSNALGNRRAAFGASVLTDGLAVNGKE